MHDQRNRQTELKLLGYLQAVPVREIPRLDSQSREFQLAHQEASDVMAFEEPRCCHPDSLDPDIAAASASDLSANLGIGLDTAAFYQAAHAGVAEANWPNPCRSRLKYGRNFKSLPGLTQAQTDQVWWGIANNWTAVSGDLAMRAILDPDVDPLTLDIAASLGPLPGSTLAWNHFARDTCSVTIYGKYDSTHRWSVVMAVTTGTHEIGHGLGHQHVRDSSALMYPSINRAAQGRRGYPNATDRAQHARLGYELSGRTEPLTDSELWKMGDEPDTPNPLPPVPSDGPQIELDNGVLTVKGPIPAGESRRFIIVPATEV